MPRPAIAYAAQNVAFCQIGGSKGARCHDCLQHVGLLPSAEHSLPNLNKTTSQYVYTWKELSTEAFASDCLKDTCTIHKTSRQMYGTQCNVQN